MIRNPLDLLKLALVAAVWMGVAVHAGAQDDAGGATLYVNDGAGSSYVSSGDGLVTSSATLTETGGGTLTLAGANSYTGGTLDLSGSVSGVGVVSGPVTVAAAASSGTLMAGSSALAGNGLTLNTGVNLYANATLGFALGPSASAITSTQSGPLQFAPASSSSTYTYITGGSVIGVGAVGEGTTLLDFTGGDLTGSRTLSPTNTFQNLQLYLNNGDLIQVTGSATIISAPPPTHFSAGVDALGETLPVFDSASASPGGSNATITVVPEPSAWMLVLAGVGLLIFWRRVTRGSC